MAIKQENRLISISTPLGEDVLVLVSMQGSEQLSRLFSYQLELVSDNTSIKPGDIVGQNVTFSVLLGDKTPRYFNGFISQFSAGDEQHGRRRYRAEAVPWLWFLTRRRDCRIFQDQTIPEIIEEVFGDAGFSDYDLSGITGSHPKWEYLVQYRETDCNFVCRLLEQEGIFFFFKHEDGKHTLVLADDKSAYFDADENEVEYLPERSETLRVDRLTSWDHCYEFRTGRMAHTDYNFETPTANLMADTNTVVKLPDVANYEYYDYPGEYTVKSDGQTLADLRMEEEEVAHETIHGAGTYRTFTPGAKFTIKKHPASTEEGKKYVLTNINHAASVGSGEEFGYQNSFTCIPDSVAFRPARITPKPLIQGHQTAVVVGPPGEEIWPDKYGRVKVQFHWDRKGKKDDKSSCWIRFGTMWAGKQWGAISIPRIGHEVMVSFLEADPDRPIITGCVYNADNMPPYTLPDDKTQSGIKSRSSMGGSDENFNEIRFEDKKDEEQVFIHAERNQDIEVENDETHWVGRDRSKTIDRDEKSHIERDRTETVGHNEKITIGNDRTERVENDEKITIGNNRTEQVNKDERITIGQNRKEEVGKDETLSVAGNRKEQISKDEEVKIVQNRNHNIGQHDTLTVGKNLLIEAGDQITLVTGGASIVMKKSGDITINGKNIKVDGSGKINIKAASDVNIKGSQIKNN